LCLYFQHFKVLNTDTLHEIDKQLTDHLCQQVLSINILFSLRKLQNKRATDTEGFAVFKYNWNMWDFYFANATH